MNSIMLAAASAAFNLTCSGTVETNLPAQLVQRSEAYSTVYRIDLDRKKWCAGDCRALFDIAEVTPTAIILTDKDVDTPREHEVTRRLIFRETGREASQMTTGFGAYEATTFWKGICEKAAFTGFPEFETKF